MTADENQVAGMITVVMNTEVPAEEKKRYEELRAMLCAFLHLFPAGKERLRAIR